VAGRSDAELDALVEQAIVDAYDEYEQLASFHVVIEEHLAVASMAATGASCAAQRARAWSGTSAEICKYAAAVMSARNFSMRSENSGSRTAWWNSSRNPAGDSASYRLVFVSSVASSLMAGLVSRHHAVLMIWAAGGR
jgi:hypothetical protein